LGLRLVPPESHGRGGRNGSFDLHSRGFERSPFEYVALFADYIHPSAAGYRVMAETWFEAITKRR